MWDATPAEERRHRERSKPSVVADILYDAFYSAALGGSAVGLFFLLVDSAGGQPFYTPSLLGHVLFLGAEPAAVTEVRLDLVAYFTMLHFAAFGFVGLTLAILVHEVEIHSRHPRELIGGLFVVLMAGSLIGATVLMPGVVETIGFGRIVIGNLLAAVTMALFYIKVHNPPAWERLVSGKPFV